MGMRVSSTLGAALVVAGIAGCYLGGNPSDPPTSSGSTTLDCTKRHGGDAPMRRLSLREYRNTIRDLLGDTTTLAQTSFPADARVNGFDDNATVLTVSGPLQQAYFAAAESLAQNAVVNMTQLLGCDPNAQGNDACARSFFTNFGKRAYRRPLAQSEVDALFAQYQAANAQWGFSDAVRLVLERILVSPNFLYRVELGASGATDPNLVPLGAYERASRLSYLLWSSMPDDVLMAAADADQLGTPDQIAAQAVRMLADPKARSAVAAFHLEWLGVDGPTPQKVASIYPEWNDGIAAAMIQETNLYVQHVVFDAEGTLSALLSSPYTFANAELASFYGLSGPTSSAFEKVAVDPTERLGLLTQGSVLANYAKPDESSPIHRGKFVRVSLLCTPPPSPPPNVPPLPAVDSGGTTRERFAEHSQNPVCAACHSLMDPVGFGFESFDGIGRWRTMDQGAPVDASGDLEQTDDSNGTFVGVPQLATRLAASAQVQRCFALELFRYGQGRTETDDDACTLQELDDAFAASGGDIRSLFVTLTKTDTFLYRKATP